MQPTSRVQTTSPTSRAMLPPVRLLGPVVDCLCAVDGSQEEQTESLAAIYTVLIGAVSASFDTERMHHLISRDCLANLQLCLEVSLDMLTKGIRIDHHPMLEFMDEVKTSPPCSL